MPIYEYQCRNCNHVFDVLQKMSDAPLQVCPECGQPELRKLLSAPNFRLKGGGWYETDFKDTNKRNLADGSGKGDAGSGDKKPDEKKSDTKQADNKAAGGADSAAE